MFPGVNLFFLNLKQLLKIVFKGNIQYGKCLKKNQNMFFDILKIVKLGINNKVLSIAYKMFWWSIGFPSNIQIN